MAAAQILPLAASPPIAESDRSKRRKAVDSVLGTMGAEGEHPSANTLALMDEYADGHMTMTELVDTIFARASATMLPTADLHLAGELQRTQRRRIIDSALGTTLAEGISPGDEVLALADRYAVGEISLDEFGAMTRAMSGL